MYFQDAHGYYWQYVVEELVEPCCNFAMRPVRLIAEQPGLHRVIVVQDATLARAILNLSSIVMWTYTRGSV